MCRLHEQIYTCGHSFSTFIDCKNPAPLTGPTHTRKKWRHMPVREDKLCTPCWSKKADEWIEKKEKAESAVAREVQSARESARDAYLARRWETEERQRREERRMRADVLVAETRAWEERQRERERRGRC